MNSHDARSALHVLRKGDIKVIVYNMGENNHTRVG